MGTLRRHLSTLVLLTFAFDELVFPSTACATPVTASGGESLEEARTRFEKGLQLYNEGAYDAALLEFRRAYELDPSKFQVLYNIGQVYFQLNDYAGALQSFEDYLVKGRDLVPTDRRTDVQREIEKLRLRVARLEIVTNVDGAEISIDDVAVGRSPLKRSLIVNSGRRRIAVSAAGRLPAAKTVEVAGADAARVELELVAPEPSVPLSAASSPSSPAQHEGLGPWVGWVITGALATGAIVTGVVALGASSDLKDQQSRLGVAQSDLDSTSRKANAFALATDVLGGLALAAGGISLYYTLSRSPSKERTAGSMGSPSALTVGVAPGGVQFAGSF